MCPPLSIPARSKGPGRKCVSGIVRVVNGHADAAAVVELKAAGGAIQLYVADNPNLH